MDQPTDDSVVPVGMNTARNFVNKASDYNSGVDYFTPHLFPLEEFQLFYPSVWVVTVMLP